MNLYGYTANDPINRFDLNGLDWQYSQSTGQLSHVDGKGNVTLVGIGYSGVGEGVNNPAMHGVENVGPIPQGTYDIGPQQNNVTNDGRTTLHASMLLTPREGTDLLGRPGGFIMHGDNRTMNRTASQGCPILPRNVRDQVANSGDTTFTVVP